MDKWWSADFSIQTWCIPLEAFASKNNVPSQKKTLNTIDWRKFLLILIADTLLQISLIN